ncbi:alpha/beta hydrolase [Lentilactobacillus senioris]|uniref:alpha/beta fold hydrolase n=1 Tax=Lentilactobacillus senioris TaxID=931534 RepID=UPI00227DE302|nr:alpha/beta hydrolase [Lentilactobacillus senioris]MCY9806369.1 alpha/beta hydrolase [Lentilactobacillus senioris]
MHFLTSDGVNLNYDDIGTGQPVLIMTGYAGYKEIWHSQVQQLLKHGYRVINLDRRNHGHSETTTKGLRMSRQGKDVAELLHALNLSNVDMIGNSMGAAVIWAYCSLYGDNLIHKIISVDQSPKMISDDDWRYGMLDITWDNFPTSAEQMYHVHTTYQRINDETYKIVKEAQGNEKFDYELNRPLLYDHAFQDWRDVIAGLQVPILFMAGEKSPFWPAKHAEVSAKIAQNGQFFIVPKAGHILMAEQTEIFNESMLSFLND